LFVTQISTGVGIDARTPVNTTIEGQEQKTIEQESDAPTQTDKKVYTSLSKNKNRVSNIVKTYFRDNPIMYEVAFCESTLRHYNRDGSLLRGHVDPRDVGVMQINEGYHLEHSEKLGYDIHTLEGNLAYAKYLYEKYGLQPWSASKPCWSKRHIAQK